MDFLQPGAPPEQPLPPRPQNPDEAARTAIRNRRQGRGRSSLIVELPSNGLSTTPIGTGLGTGARQ